MVNRNRNIGGCHGLSGILDTLTGTTSTILNIFNQASNLVPVPFVHPLVASVASLLTAVQVSFRMSLSGAIELTIVSKPVLIMET